MKNSIGNFNDTLKFSSIFNGSMIDPLQAVW